MPGHRDDDGEAGDDDGSTGGRPGEGDRVAHVGARRPLLARPADDEEGVVDADGEADEQDQALRVRVDGEDALARGGGEAEGDTDAAEAQDERHPGGDDRAEGDEEDEQGQRDADQLGLLEVLAERGVELLGHRAVADLADGEVGVRCCEGRGGLQRRAHRLVGRLGGGALGRLLLRVEGEREDDAAAVGARLRLADRRHALDAGVGRRELGADPGHLVRGEDAVLRGRDDGLGRRRVEPGPLLDLGGEGGVADELVLGGRRRDPLGGHEADAGDEGEGAQGEHEPAVADAPVRDAGAGAVGVDRRWCGGAVGRGRGGRRGRGPHGTSACRGHSARTGGCHPERTRSGPGVASGWSTPGALLWMPGASGTLGRLTRASRASGGTADALASGASVRKGVGVQIPPCAQNDERTPMLLRGSVRRFIRHVGCGRRFPAWRTERTNPTAGADLAASLSW